MITLNEVVPYEGRFGTIRGITIDGVPWFVGKDVALALGYAKPSNAIYDHVDPKDKRFVMFDNLLNHKDMLQPCGISQSRVALINESGVYALVFASKLPSAVKFRDWVCDEVLPSVMKYGVYPPPEVILQRWIANPAEALAFFDRMKQANNNDNNITIEV